MNHTSAVEGRFTERYLLGELDDASAAEFEDHYFQCPECAEDVRQAGHLAANLKAAFRDEGPAPVIEIGKADRFLDLTVPVTAPGPTTVECEFRFGAAKPVVVETRSSEGSLHLLLRADLFRAGPCVLIIREKGSEAELERRQFVVSRSKA